MQGALVNKSKPAITGKKASEKLSRGGKKREKRENSPGKGIAPMHMGEKGEI